MEISDLEANILEEKEKINFYETEIQNAADLASGKSELNDKEINESRKKYEEFILKLREDIQNNENIKTKCHKYIKNILLESATVYTGFGFPSKSVTGGIVNLKSAVKACEKAVKSRN